MGLAITILVLSLVMFWPGFTQPDTNYQYEQALTGKVNDWNPPAMTRLWQALLIFGHGSGSIYTLQMSMYWLGLGLLAQALGGRKALAILAIGAFPALLGWETCRSIGG